MSSSLISSLYGGQEAAFQEQLERQFRENLARDPVAMQAYQKATGGNTPWYSPSALSASENERAAAIRRTNQMSRGAQAVRERAIAQGRDVSVSPERQIQIGDPDPYKAIGQYRTLPSGLNVDQVESLPGGGKAVYDREGRLVGTNTPVDTGMSAADRAAFSRGEGLASERSALRPAMEDAVRKAMESRVAAQAEAAPRLPQPRTFTEALTELSIPNFSGTRPLAPSAPAVETESVVSEAITEPARPQLGRMPTSLAGTGFEEQINQFYATPPPQANSDPFASRTTPGLENVLRKHLPITVGRQRGSEALIGQVLPRSEGKLASAFRLLTEWPGVSDADVAELATAFPDMDWSTKGLTAAEASRKFQGQLNELARSGRITAASDQEVTPRVGPYSVQQGKFDYRLQTPEERVRTALTR
jgi:hypothetical protein